MILVVVTHVNFYSIGWPTPEELVSSPLSTYIRTLFESFSIISVDCFVLISGWFGINPTKQKATSFIFQSIFFSVSLFLICIFLRQGVHSFSELGPLAVKSVLCADYWIVYSYLALFIFSPMLNALVEKASQKELRNTLLSYFILQAIFGWIFDGNGFESGYSVISFMGLYLLGRYIHLYPCKLTNLSARTDLLIYFALSIAISALAFFTIKIDNEIVMRAYAYSSPLVIMSSVYFFLFFSKLNFTSKPINYIAKSAFAVYLLHCHPLVTGYFAKTADSIYTEYSGIYYFAAIAAYITIVFAAAVLFDQIRIYLWKLIKTYRERR